MKHRLFLVGVFSVFSLLVSFESIAANSGIAQVHAKVPNTEAKLSALTYLKNMNKTIISDRFNGKGLLVVK